MRRRLPIVASAIAGTAQILITSLGFAVWFGVLVWPVRGGNLRAVAQEFAIGVAAVTPLSGILMRPFRLPALGIAAPTRSSDEARDTSAHNDR